MLLDRKNFRESVFERDDHKCVICGEFENLDAHHIIERRLFDDGGYYIDNGATLCDKGTLGCHYKAEQTLISVEDIRIASNIKKKIMPEFMYSDHVYDKWGNTILQNGNRTKGPLFFDESVQKVIEPVIHLFTDYVKYPRTYHLPWSEGKTDDDRTLNNLDCFIGNEVVVTEKMDGENFSGYKNYCHARSVDGRNHWTRNWAKDFWYQKSYELPEGWRVCCENMFAEHSISYDDLDSFLYGFSIWNERNECLSWKDTVEWFELLEISMVKVLYQGIFDENKIREISKDIDFQKCEGYVLRNSHSFNYNSFRNNVAKLVRKNHVQTIKHWMHGSKIVENKLKKVS